MSDRLDKELGRHVRTVFDAYEEPFDAGNWQVLQRKRHGRAVALYMRRGGIAAAIALLLAAGIVLWNSRSGVNDAYLSDVAPGENAPAMALENESLSSETGTADETIAANEADDAGTAAASGGVKSTADAVSELQANIMQKGVSSSVTPRVSGKDQGADPAGQTRDLAAAGTSGLTERPQRPAESGQSAAEQNLAEELVADQGAAAGSDDEQQHETEQQSGAIAAAPERSGSDVVTVSAGSGDRSSRFSVGFVTTSLMNYADGNTASNVNFGAGITSGWKINDRLSVHSGLILAQNSLSLNRSNSSVRASTYALDKAATTEISTVGKNNIVQNVSSNGMDVSLLVVDIPLNMTYRVGLGGPSLLLTGGVSSFAYLDQEYSYHNTMQLYTNATVEAPEPVIRDENAFSHFDFARQLNFAVGTEVPLGNGSVLILEPYLKYPLGTLTSEHIRFGSAGMNLRFSFGTK